MAFAVRVASAAILYFSQVVLARWMGGFEYGIYVFVWTWVLVLSGLSHLGMPTAMIRLLPEYIQLGQHGLLRGLLLGGRAVAVLSGTAVACAALALIWLLGARLNSHYVLPFVLALACVPLCALSDVQDGIGRGRGWMAVGLMPPYILRPLLLLGCMTARPSAGPADQRRYRSRRRRGRHLGGGAGADAAGRASLRRRDRQACPGNTTSGAGSGCRCR